jgi:hypothetical protein
LSSLLAIVPKQLKSAIEALGDYAELKGSVTTSSLLPSTGNKLGDIYYVEDLTVGYIFFKDSLDVEK